MPSWITEIDFRRLDRIRDQACREVRAKFPGLMKGTSGWHRALQNRMRRLGYR